MKKTDNSITNHQSGLKSYVPVKLTVYGKMVDLTASGSGNGVENNVGSGSTKVCSSNKGLRC